MPAASQSIQIQRGVGSSLYGSGALGGSINVITKDAPADKSLSVTATAGQYGIFKGGIDYNSGLIHGNKSLIARFNYLEGNGWRQDTFYRGIQYYLAGMFFPNERNTFKVILHGAPQYHAYAYMGFWPQDEYGVGYANYGKDWNGHPHVAEDELKGTDWDDRFDFILLSHHMLRDSGPLTYVTGTYNAYGNDGNHFNGEINSGTNGVVSAAIADALYYASDHLPVMLELSYPTTMTVADGVARPVTYALHQNYPNPFNPGTMIQFDLPVGSDTRIAVYDLLGREVVRLADGRLEPGYHQLLWNGRDTRGRAVPTGMYIVLMMTPEFGKNIKVLLLR